MPTLDLVAPGRRRGSRSCRARSTTASASWPTPSASTRRRRSSSTVDPSAGTRRSVAPVCAGSRLVRAARRPGEAVEPGPASRVRPVTGRRRGRPGCRHDRHPRRPDATSSVARRAAPCPSPTPRSSRTTASLDVAADGIVRFTQLTGTRRGPARTASPSAGRWRWRTARPSAIGSSRLRVGRSAGPTRGAAALTADPADPWRSTVHRTPRPLAALGAGRDPRAGRPHRRPGCRAGIGVTAAVCTMVGSVVIALVMRSPLFLLLGAVGLLASVGMWVAGRVGAARDGRRAGRRPSARAGRLLDGRGGAASRPLAAPPRDHTARGRGDRRGDHRRADVWGRRGRPRRRVPGDARLGTGDVGGRPRRLAGRRRDVGRRRARRRWWPLPSSSPMLRSRPSSAHGAALAVAGPTADSVVRSIIVQLATWTGPADWRLVAVVDDPPSWDWCRWLPHGPADTATGRRRRRRRCAGGDAPPGRRRRRRSSCRRRDGPPRSRRPAHRRAASLPRCRARRPPSSCRCRRATPCRRCAAACSRSARSVGHGGGPTRRSRLVRTSSTRRASRWRTAGRVARALAALRDPEDPSASDDAGARWCRSARCASSTGSARSTTPSPSPRRGAPAVPILRPPHRSGSPPTVWSRSTSSATDRMRSSPARLAPARASCCARSSCRSAARCSPDHLTFVLVDYKGGATFDACAELPHTVGLVTDLDDRLAERALVSLEAELRRRERILRARRRIGPRRVPVSARAMSPCRGSSS